MTSPGERLAKAAASCIDVPFRLHGRDPRFGLDCVGLVYFSLSAIGRRPSFPATYGLRNVAIEALLAFAKVNRLAEAQGEMTPGDILLVRPGPAQHHLTISDGSNGFIHAHAGLKRVVRMPGALPWPLERRWCLQADN